ncbi:hypothetical protein [Alkalihalobacillus sp. CinArs1]|uniref:hypothetical protein n=1 Tax=Alkalihalobacillus sp. CinArs1 TaxID=2995314 RepID=UPI0022DE87B8|nr:hypothetical protein [Alkalihalobacillus sp. CinArs1]
MVTGLLLIDDKNSELLNTAHYKEKLDEFLMITRPFTEEIIIVSNHPKIILPYTPRDIRIVTEYYKHSGILGQLHAGLSLSSYQANIVVDYETSFHELELQPPIEEFSKTNPDLILFEKSKINGIYNKSIVPVLSEYLEHPSKATRKFDDLNFVL